MGNSILRMEELILRVPGCSEDEARNLGEKVARYVADGLPAQQEDKHLGALDLRVTIPPEIPQGHMAEIISEAILKGLV